MIPSKECLNKLIEYINEEKPNAAILTGDIIDYYSESNYSLLKDSISKIRCPYIFTIGNHEAPVEKFEEIK